MNKNNILNVIKIILSILIIVLLAITSTENYLILIPTMALPISAFYMNKYKRNIKKNIFVYQVLRKVLTFFSIIWMFVILYNTVRSIFTYEFITNASYISCYFCILFNICIIIDILTNKENYSNNVLFVVYFISLIILIRLLTSYHLTNAEWYFGYYKNNIITLCIISLITWINGYIELNRLNLKKEA